MKIEIRPGRLLNISFHENPESDTTLFLIHGLGGSGAQWRHQLAILNNHFSVVIPDLFGLGESEKPWTLFSNPYNFTELDQDLQAMFVRYANKNNVVMGHSYGGAFAVSLADYFQEKINKLILIDPTLAEPKTQLPPIFNYPAFILQCVRPALEKMFNQAAYDPSTPPELIAEENKATRKNKMYVIKAMVKGMKMIRKINVSQLKMPVLIIIGENDKIILPDNIKNFYEKIPHHEMVIVSNAAHMVMLEQPEITNELIRVFLSK